MKRSNLASGVCLGLLPCALAAAQSTVRVSVDSSGTQADSQTYSAGVSADGRFVVFRSDASNLVAGVSGKQVYVHDRASGATTCASVDSAGAPGNAQSIGGSLSPDGRYVLFESNATNFVPGDGSDSDVFLHDRVSGATTIVSVDSNGTQANGDSHPGKLSADGRFATFWSTATNLASPDTNDSNDVFVRDLQAGTTTRVSVDSAGGEANGPSIYGSLSADGRSVGFLSSASNLVPGDTNLSADAFVHDRLTGTTTLVSLGTGGAHANSGSEEVFVSAEGRYAVFSSFATNLVPGDTNGLLDVFVRDLVAGSTERISLGIGGAEGDGLAYARGISSDGRFVAIESWSSNLVLGDTNDMVDVFLHDRLAGAMERVSVTSSGAQGAAPSFGGSVSADGRHVVFLSFANNLVAGDTNNVRDAFVRDRGIASAFVVLCTGDGSAGPCPCGNQGAAGRGCENSAGTGGARLDASGAADLAADTVQLQTAGELPAALSIVLQGDAVGLAAPFGDGLRCAGGLLLRLYTQNAVGGSISAPGPGEPAVSARSAALGDPLPLGATRAYQVYYRDPGAGFCPPPSGSTFNATNAVAIAWGS